MRVEATPLRFSAVPGRPSLITVTVTNTRDVISGHELRVLGVDPQWATIDQESLSLFPEASGVAIVTVTLPKGIPAGVRHLSIQVVELTPPAETEVVAIELTVPAEPTLTLLLDPASINGGNEATAGLLVENTGNSPVDAALTGVDEAGEVAFTFQPPDPSLMPGEQVLSAVTLRARRPWFGSPKVRPFTLNAGPPQAPVMAFGAWIQKPRLSRGALALMGLVAALTVFALVLTSSFSQVVTQSAADRDLALQVAQAAQSSSGGGTGSIAGTVTLLSSGQPVGGVTAQLFPAANPTSPIASTATGVNGIYRFAGLAASTYKLLFSGAGFTQVWYATALTPDNATTVTVQRGQAVAGVNVLLGGLPATISGQVAGADPSGALLTLELPPAGAGAAAAATAGTSAGTAVPSGAVVTTRTLDSSGSFTIGSIPSPSVYLLVVTKQGYATATQEIDLSGGETRNGIVITLTPGNGSISGTVSGTSGPLSGATITATAGTTSVSTVTLASGAFTLSNLPTPATFTVLVGASGDATQTLSLALASDQQLAGVAVTLDTGVGSISGVVSTADGALAGGVTVTATNGQLTVTTVTLSQGSIGSYTLAGLPVPFTYSVTFARPDLASQTQQISVPGTGTGQITGVNASLVANTAALFGTVTQAGGTPLGETTVLLTSGSTSYQVTSATVPTLGAYEVDNVTPGTYTVSFSRPGGLATSSIVTLAAGQRLEDNPVLSPAASIFGHVVSTTTQLAVPGADVTLYLASQFPTVALTSTLTDSNGNFTFNNVNAPENYVVAVAFPVGAAPQVTVLISTTLGTPAPVCGANATTAPSTTTVPGTPPCDPTTDPVLVGTG